MFKQKINLYKHSLYENERDTSQARDLLIFNKSQLNDRLLIGIKILVSIKQKYICNAIRHFS